MAGKAWALSLLCSISWCAWTTAYGEEELSLEKLFDLGDAVVTASKYAQSIDEAPAIVQVFDRRYIDTTGAQTISDLLNYLSGTVVYHNTQAIDMPSIRGTQSAENNKVLILIDGYPFKDALYAHGYIDEYVPLHMVKRVEVIKGPGSALYGANAFSAVINLITFDGKNVNSKGLSFLTGSRYENKTTFLAGGAVDSMVGPLDVLVYGKMYKTQGMAGDWRLDNTVANFQQSRPQQAYSSGIKLKAGNLQFKADTWSFRTVRIDGRFDENNMSNVALNQEDMSNYRYYAQLLSLQYDLNLNENLNILAKTYYQYYDHPATYGDMNFQYNDVNKLTTKDATGADSGSVTIPKGTYLTFPSPSFNAVMTLPVKKTYRYGSEVQLTHRSGSADSVQNILVTGVDAMVDAVEMVEDREFVWGNANNTNRGMKSTRAEMTVANGFDIHKKEIPNIGVYAQDTVNIAAARTGVTLGLRHDKHKYFGTNLSPRAGVTYSPSKEHVLKLLYGKAFRAPTARENLISKGTKFTSGNTDLKPEIIVTSEIEYTLKLMQGLRASLSYFQNSVTDIIEIGNVTDAELGKITQYVNSGKHTSRGYEIGVNWRGESLEAFGNYSAIKAKDGIADVEEFGIPKYMAKAGVTYWPDSHLWLGLRGIVMGKFSQEAYTTYLRDTKVRKTTLEDLPAYQTMDATVGTKEVIKGLQLSLNIINLANKTYQTPMDKGKSSSDQWQTGGYEAPGRNMRVQADYKF